MNKELIIEYLYLDLQTCDRCIGTDQVLDKVITELTPALELAGFSITYRKTEIITAHMAEQYHFLSSPTIRVNGKDICRTVSESDCAYCSDISGTDVDCRVFEYDGLNYDVPPKEMLAEAIMRSVFAPPSEHCSCYALPENLKTFFHGKENKQAGILKTSPDVKVLGSGCSKCNALENAAKGALEELNMDTTIEHVTDFAQIAAYGVMSTPALVVNGKLVSVGRVLKKDEVITLLKKCEEDK